MNAAELRKYGRKLAEELALLALKHPIKSETSELLNWESTLIGSKIENLRGEESEFMSTHRDSVFLGSALEAQMPDIAGRVRDFHSLHDQLTGTDPK
jgi:hypothetical protein